MTKGKERRSPSLFCFSCPAIGLALCLVLALLLGSGRLTPVHAQWLAPVSSASSLMGWGFPSWSAFSYPQAAAWAAPFWQFPDWQGLSFAYNLSGSPLISSPAWGRLPLFPQVPLPTYGRTAFPLLQNVPAAALAMPISASLLRGEASASPPGDRRTVGIESKLIQYKPPAIRSTAAAYVPGFPAYTSNQVIVTFRPGTSSVEVDRVCAKHGCRQAYTSPYAGYTILNIPNSSTILQTVQRLRTEASILFAEPNYLRHAHFVPNDPYYTYQWHLPRLNCNYAWDYATGTGAVVALLDSGVAFEANGTFAKAPDLAGTLFAPGYDFVNNDIYPDDDYGHGTHMAGCIAQTTNNLLGCAGAAFNAAIMPVKVMDNIGGVVISTEVDGIYFAANSGAKVISMSLGGPGTSATEAAAITYAYSNGVTVVCSAGNAGSSTPEYPASYPEPISVSAIRYDYSLPAYSNYGQYIDVCSPGGDLSVDQNLDGFGDGILQQTHSQTDFTTFYYYFMEGTSPACALVSGVAALVIGKSTIPLTSANVVSIIEGSTTDLGTVGWDQYFGYGLVNAYLAVLRTP